ncbi:MAG: LytTR family DNA-binding domain-containing protein [Bacteroidota bacterium]
MHVLIVEDEAAVADRIERLCRQVRPNSIHRLVKQHSLSAGLDYLQRHPIDLLLLDLNLNGQDGFALLQELLSQSFHTIIISANTDRAIQAFEFGVLDFIAKPFLPKRLAQAFARFDRRQNNRLANTEYLAVRKKGLVKLLPIGHVNFIKAAGNYSEIHLLNQQIYLHDKSLNSLDLILPQYFKRIHRSYICNWQQADQLINHGAGKYLLRLHSGDQLPVSRSRYSDLVALGI